MPRPRRNALNHAHKLHIVILSRVTHLLSVRAPFAIHQPSVCNAFLTMTAGVMAAVVFSVNRSAWRAWRHICFPTHKRLTPSGAHFYAAPAVVSKILSVLVGASVFHRLPNPIIVASSHPVVTTTATSAGFRFLGDQITPPNRVLFPAVANAFPTPANRAASREILSGESNYKKAIKTFSGEVDKLLVCGHRTLNNFGRFFHSICMTEFSEGRSAATGGLCVFDSNAGAKRRNPNFGPCSKEAK